MSVRTGSLGGFKANQLALCIAMAIPALAHAQESVVLPAVEVNAQVEEAPSEKTGAYRVKKSKSATSMNMTQLETPQSVSVITRAQMDDFRLTSVNDVLRATPGVVVENVETDRTYYTARGFDITNFQNDGIGIPMTYGLVDGNLDTAIYDRVEVVRGANGLMSNTGNPSATVSFIRKRPTAETQSSVGVSYGSWNDRRVDVDASGSLNEAQTLRGRIVGVVQDRDSYLDRYSHKKEVLYGILEADVGERTTLGLGHVYQKNTPKGNLWGGLPLYYSDGTPTDYDRSTSTAPAWTSWLTEHKQTFAELRHEFDNEWEVKAVYTHKEGESGGDLFYVYGVPDPLTGLGSFSWPSQYTSHSRDDIFDVRVAGPFRMWGQKHEFVAGASASISRLNAQSMDSVRNIPLPPLSEWNGDYPEPDFNIVGDGADILQKQRSLYAATRLSLNEQTKLILGLNGTRVEAGGTNYSVPWEKNEYETVPYAGLVVDITRSLAMYGSYTEIFRPQHELQNNGLSQPTGPLAPATGDAYEVGVKSELFDKSMIGSIAYFRTRQENLAGSPIYVDVGNPPESTATYLGTDVSSDGIELELVGAVTKRLQLSAGYTHLLSLEDEDGNDTRPYTPRRMFKLATVYRVPEVDGLRVGGSLRWQSGISGKGTMIAPAPTITQPAYAIVDLMAGYDINRNASLTFNINNVTDKKYLTSLYWADQGFYGAPRSASVALNLKF